MKTSRIVSVMIVVAGLTIGASNEAEASVRGSRFAGGFVTNLGFPAVCTASFGTDGVLTQWEYGVLFGGTYIGTYTEIGTGMITYWRSVVPDESPNGTATFSGYCLFGVITTFHNQNLDQGITVDGLLIRTGSAPPPSSNP